MSTNSDGIYFTFKDSHTIVFQIQFLTGYHSRGSSWKSKKCVFDWSLKCWAELSSFFLFWKAQSAISKLSSNRSALGRSLLLWTFIYGGLKILMSQIKTYGLSLTIFSPCFQCSWPYHSWHGCTFILSLIFKDNLECLWSHLRKYL